jgi:hypothetical protein
MTGKNVAETGIISPERAEMGLLCLVGYKTFFKCLLSKMLTWGVSRAIYKLVLQNSASLGPFQKSNYIFLLTWLEYPI